MKLALRLSRASSGPFLSGFRRYLVGSGTGLSESVCR